MKAVPFKQYTLLFCFLTTQVFGAEVLSLNQYLDMARSKDPAVQATQQAVEGAKLTENSPALMTGIYFFANSSMLNVILI